ncbi:MAG: hypothetical protein V3W04_07405 [Gammaproteobacteria bacterium]
MNKFTLTGISAAVLLVTSQSAFAFRIKVSSVAPATPVAVEATIEVAPPSTTPVIPPVSDPLVTPTPPLENAAASPVPVPAAAWLLGSAVLGFAGFFRRQKN